MDGGAPFGIILSALQNGVAAISNIGKTLAASFPQVTGTSTSATAGTATLTSSQPAGFVTVLLPNGNTVKIPYYN